MANEGIDKAYEEEELAIQAYQAARRFSNYKTVRNKVTSELHKPKKHFFQSINSDNPKEFRRAVKHLTKNQHAIPYLIDQEVNEANSCREKANVLNLYFTKCFNTGTAPLNEVHHDIPPTDYCFTDLYCDELQICDLLYGLDISKSSGPDDV